MANTNKVLKNKTRWRRVWVGLGAGLCVLALVVVTYVRFFVDEPLRRTVEHNVNQRLKGYTARIGALHFHPFTLSVDLKDATILQDAHPNPPIAHLPLLHAGVHWRALLRGRLVADFFIDAPRLNINLRQARKEAENTTPVTERGWQDALAEIYPLKVNVLEVRNADITYVDEGPFKPLHLSKVNFEARNIRNAQSKKATYPSDIHLDGVVFDKGKLVVDGYADFLAKPYPGIKADFSFQEVALDYFKPIIQRYHFTVRDGVLSSDGMFEYAPNAKVAHLKQVTVEKVYLEYIHRSQTADDEQAMGQRVAQTAKELHNNSEVLVRVDQVHVKNSELAYSNQAATPEYRLYFSDVDLKLDNMSNQSTNGTATGKLQGRFMGTGPSVINVAWRPNTSSSDFNVSVRIDNTELKRLNDLLRAYGKFDVTEGQFALYSEASIRNGEINGYVKPFFKDVKVYDSTKDADKPFLQKVREGLIGALAWVFSNKPRREVATTINLTGQFDSPQYSSWEAFSGMLKNAFIAALRRDFESKSPPPPNVPAKAQPESSPSPLAG